ncbi:MAG: DUF642 domain-containing protein, partial [Planctomycetes bacterium]|nr:DUF642 domain-containing protein [Planctomycetota bacterium]
NYRYRTSETAIVNGVNQRDDGLTMGIGAYSTATAALANAPVERVTLAQSGWIDFFIGDDPINDNQGGISLQINSVDLSVPNLITNGDFEAPPNTVFSATTTVPGWTVQSGNVDIDRNNSPSTPLSDIRTPDGNFALDLTGTLPVGTSNLTVLSQTLTTVPGNRYVLSFLRGGSNGHFVNPFNYSSDGGGPRTMEVAINGATVGSYQTDLNFASRTAPDPQWRVETLEFVATSATTTLSFKSLNTGVFGPLLDAVRVVPSGSPQNLKVAENNGWNSSTKTLTLNGEAQANIVGYRVWETTSASSDDWRDTGAVVLTQNGSTLTLDSGTYSLDHPAGGARRLRFTPTLNMVLENNDPTSGGNLFVQGSTNNPSLTPTLYGGHLLKERLAPFPESRRMSQFGAQFVDLNSTTTGSVSQSINTVAGQRYRLSFWHGANSEWRYSAS